MIRSRLSHVDASILRSTHGSCCDKHADAVNEGLLLSTHMSFQTSTVHSEDKKSWWRVLFLRGLAKLLVWLRLFRVQVEEREGWCMVVWGSRAQANLLEEAIWALNSST